MIVHVIHEGSCINWSNDARVRYHEAVVILQVTRVRQVVKRELRYIIDHVV